MRLKYLLFFLLLLPVFIFRDYTPDNELRYISIVEEALRNHTWFTFYTHGEIYADKPPLYFWLIMLTKGILGSYQLWAVGLISIFPVIGIMILMDRWLKTERVKISYWMPDMLLLTTGMFLGGMLVLRMDMLMTFFIVLSLYTFYRIYKQQSKPYERWALSVYIFLAIFTKGPAGILVPLVSVFSFLLLNRDLKALSRCFSWKQFILLLALCTIWFSLIYMEGGSQYLNNILVKQTVGRGFNSFHHKEAFYFYLQRMLFTFAPWSLLYFVVLLSGVCKRIITTDLERYFLSIIVSCMILFSLISAKIDIYLLPIYPFIVYLTVILMLKMKFNKLLKACVAVPAVIFVFLFPISFFMTSYIPFAYNNLTMVYTGLFLISTGGVAGLFYLWKNQQNRAITAIASGVLGLLFIASFAIPQFNNRIGLKMLALKGEELASQYNLSDYAFYKFRSGENMDVYLNKQLLCIESMDKLKALDSGKPIILFVGYYELQREEELKQWLADKENICQVGDYNVLIIGGKN